MPQLVPFFFVNHKCLHTLSPSSTFKPARLANFSTSRARLAGPTTTTFLLVVPAGVGTSLYLGYLALTLAATVLYTI
jgi:hypothetical protein